MKSFKEYLLEFDNFHNIAKDLNFADVDFDHYDYDTGLYSTEQGLEYRFGDGYRVYFKPLQMRIELHTGRFDSEPLNLLPQKECYSIGLTYKTNYNTTHKNNQFFVYSHVLAAVKKFIETVPHNGFMFFGYEDKMDLVYNKMYHKYLINDYIKLDVKNYLKRSFYNSLPPDKKEFVNKYIVQALPGHYEKLKATKDEDLRDKQFLRQYQQRAKTNQNVDSSSITF